MNRDSALDLTGYVEVKGAPGDSKKLLLEVITAQEELIQVKNEALLSLLNETMEQESIINELMRERLD